MILRNQSSLILDVKNNTGFSLAHAENVVGTGVDPHVSVLESVRVQMKFEELVFDDTKVHVSRGCVLFWFQGKAVAVKPANELRLGVMDASLHRLEEDRPSRLVREDFFPVQGQREIVEVFIQHEFPFFRGLSVIVVIKDSCPL